MLVANIKIWKRHLKKYCLYLSSKIYAKQNLNVESISYKRVEQEGLKL